MTQTESTQIEGQHGGGAEVTRTAEHIEVAVSFNTAGAYIEHDSGDACYSLLLDRRAARRMARALLEQLDALDDGE